VTVASRRPFDQEIVDASGKATSATPSTHAGKESAEHHAAEKRSARPFRLSNHREDQRHEERKDRHQEQVALHYFLPIARSRVDHDQQSEKAATIGAFPYVGHGPTSHPP